MKHFIYYIIYALVYPLSLLPFRLMYLLSDGLFLFIYHVIRYRRKVVWKNLTSSFPQKNKSELKEVERKFYHWFCDYIFETFKLLTITDKELIQHIEFRGVDQIEKFFDEERNCSAILGHYCNWEWLSATKLSLNRHPQAVTGLIYHPLRSKAFDRLFIKIRSSHGGLCIPKKDILRHLIEFKRENKRTLFGYISDQSPLWENMHLWLDFLNHDTPVFTGGEKLMRKMHDVVFFIEMARPKRGYYTCTFKLITPDASNTKEFDITRRFFKLLEEAISRHPEYYLWTHNRWKRTREEFNKRYEIVNDRIVRKEDA